MSFLLTDAWADIAGASPVSRTDSSFSLLMMVGIFVLFYFMMIRPQNKRAKLHKELIKKLQKGDEVVLNSGILGKVDKLINETHLKITISSGVDILVLRETVSSVLPKGTIGSL